MISETVIIAFAHTVSDVSITHVGSVSAYPLHGDATPWIVFAEPGRYAVLGAGGMYAPARRLPNWRGRYLRLPKDHSAVYYDYRRQCLTCADTEGVALWSDVTIAGEPRLAVGSEHICWLEDDRVVVAHL